MRRGTVRITPHKLLVFQIVYNIVVKFLIFDLGFPTSLNYLTDIITLVLLLKLIQDGLLAGKGLRNLLMIVGLFFGFGVVSAIANSVNPILVIWSLRNYGRFFCWIFIFVKYFDVKKIDRLFDWANKFLLPNLLLMAYQFFVLDIRDDRLNGFFGSYVGGNSAVNTFFVILTAENISAWITKKRAVKQCCWNIALMCIMAGLNELKFYFVELVVIVFIALVSVLKRKTEKTVVQKTLRLCGISVVIAILGYQILILFYPGFSTFFSPEVLLDYATRSYNSGTVVYVEGVAVVNRLSAYGVILEAFLTTPFKLLFGIGMGAAEYSSFFAGAFHEIYGDLAISGYLLPYVLLENGLIGMFLYVLVFCISWRHSRDKMHMEMDSRYYYLFSAIISLMGIVMCVYNSALRIESSGYLYFSAMAMAFVKMKENQHGKEML